jgi:transcriptional regulator with XRE-family HTH domain
MDVRLQFGLALRRIRLSKGLSQEDLAHQAGMHPTYISRLESGRCNPSLAAMVDLGQALNTHPSKFLLCLDITAQTPPTHRRKVKE